MRPVSAVYEINQPFGSMKTAGVAPSSTPNTVGWYVKLYGNYQPYGHAGCDIACPEGTPVHAIAAGTVLWADWGTNLPGDDSNAGYRRRWYLYKSFPGIVTVIQHDGWIGVYAHLSAAHMNAGDRVTEGQQIGLSGGTGGVAPHLHVEALIDLNYTTGGGLIYGRTNPEPYFGGIAAQGSITPEDDELALTEENLKDIALHVWAFKNEQQDSRDMRQILADIPKDTLTKPVPYKDPTTGADTGQSTSLATMAGYADFQATQTRLNTNAKAVAANIPDSIAQEVIDALAARLGK